MVEETIDAIPKHTSAEWILRTISAYTQRALMLILNIKELLKAKETSYDALNKLACLLPSWISKASAHQPGMRWLRARAAGKQQVREFELVRGRAHTGKKSWIVSFDGVNNLDEARQIVGSAVLVKARDRPEIKDDEFYSLDLVGMRVIVKDTGKLVGTVGQGFNFGGGDLLKVIMGSSEGTAVDPDSENQDSISSREHV
ncbi:Ribosome maturation factor RimM [Zea mays]|uniref:Ribosome maturation factor RimM n=1 Tax=Zea mays TaxID=4577 RepID=A0A3L6D9N5_MAIZE|nr:Ribosome maturation factor RimM [Zea mays]